MNMDLSNIVKVTVARHKDNLKELFGKNKVAVSVDKKTFNECTEYFKELSDVGKEQLFAYLLRDHLLMLSLWKIDKDRLWFDDSEVRETKEYLLNLKNEDIERLKKIAFRNW